MARATGNFQQAERYHYKRWYDPSLINVQRDYDNLVSLTWADPTDSTSILGITADLDSRMQVDRSALLGTRSTQQFYFNATGGLVTQTFFIAPRAMVITSIEEIHSAAETAAGTATAVVTLDHSGSVPGTGTVVMTNTFNLKGTANTTQTATMLSVDTLGQPNAGIVMGLGDRLTIKVGGTATITALAGVVLTVFSAPGFKELTYVYNMQANASIATQSFAIAARDLVVTSVWMTWSAAGTNAGTVTMDCTIDTGTTAPGGGTSVLTAAQNVKLTANVPVNVPLSATAANLLMRAGYRLAVKTTGTLTSLAGMVVVATCGPVGTFGYMGEQQVSFTMNANGSLATQGFWQADRDYQVLDIAEVHSTAGTDAGTVTLDVTIDKGVVAPGSGTTTLAGTVNLKGTANTVNWPGVATTRRTTLISQGDVLTAKFTGTLTSLAGVMLTIALQPR